MSFRSTQFELGTLIDPDLFKAGSHYASNLLRPAMTVELIKIRIFPIFCSTTYTSATKCEQGFGCTTYICKSY